MSGAALLAESIDQAGERENGSLEQPRRSFAGVGVFLSSRTGRSLERGASWLVNNVECLMIQTCALRIRNVRVDFRMEKRIKMRILYLVFAVLFVASVLSAQRQSDAPRGLGAVTLTADSKSVPLKYSIPSSRGRVGIGSSKQYFIFRGPKAVVRTTSTTPEFQFDADASLNEASEVYLFKFDMHSDRREIRVAKGPGGLAPFSIPKDHIIPTSLEEIGDGPNSRKRYRMKPTAPLRPGEYCLARSSDYYDFGVD